MEEAEIEVSTWLWELLLQIGVEPPLPLVTGMLSASVKGLVAVTRTMTCSFVG